MTLLLLALGPSERPPGRRGASGDAGLESASDMEVGVVVCWGDALHQSRSGWPQRRLGQLRSTPSRQTPTYRGRAGWRWLQSRTSASAHAAWGERHSPGSGRSATSSARVGWSGWACASVDGWFMEHVAGAGAGGDVAQSTAGGAGDAELVAGLLFILHRRCCYRLPTSSPVNLIFK